MLNYKIYCGDIDIKNCDNKTYVICSFPIRHDDPRYIFFSLDTEKNQLFIYSFRRSAQFSSWMEKIKNQLTFIHFRQTPEYSTHNF